MDDTERYAYGHSAKGKRCYAEKPGKKSIRINFIGGLRGKQFIARCEPWSAKHGVSRPR
ncbi:hypothetical protein Psal182_02108 [Piscirickettsia salmonis]|nr:hypothetical protein Psal182_02108 [Piscirickettsia salmonis]